MSFRQTFEKLAESRTLGQDLAQAGSRELALLTTAILVGLIAAGVNPDDCWSRIAWTCLVISSGCCGFFHLIWGYMIIKVSNSASKALMQIKGFTPAVPPQNELPHWTIMASITALLVIQVVTAIVGVLYLVGVIWCSTAPIELPS